MAWIVTAITSIGAAFAAGAAVVGGAALTATAVGTIALGVANAGLILSVVGKVTKSPELMKIGKVMSIAGGVASLATSAYTAMSSGAVSAGAEGAVGSATNVTPNIAGDAMTNQAVDGAATTFGVADSGAGVATLGEGATSQIAGMEPVGSALSAPADAVTGAAGLGAKTAAPGGGLDFGLEKLGEAKLPVSIGDPSSALATGFIPKPTLLESVSEMWEKMTPDSKSRLTTGLLQGGGNAIGGMFQGWSEEQKLELQNKINDENRARYDKGVENMQYQPKIEFAKRPTGLITSIRKV